MRIVLLKQTGKLKNGVVNVANGYGMYLINKGDALFHTIENKDIFNKNIDLYKIEYEKNSLMQKKIMESLKQKTIFIISAVNETGNFYGSIRIKDVVNNIWKMSKDYKIINPSNIIMPSVKKPNVYNITVKMNCGECDLLLVAGYSQANCDVLHNNYIKNEDGVLSESEKILLKYNNASKKLKNDNIKKADHRVEKADENISKSGDKVDAIGDDDDKLTEESGLSGNGEK